MDITLLCLKPKFLHSWGCPGSRPASSLLNNYLPLLCIDTAPGILRRDRDHALAQWQGWGEVVKTAVGAQHRHLPAVHHHSASHLSFACYLDHMPMLYKRIQFQGQSPAVPAFGNDGKAVLFALHGLPAILIVSLHCPVVRPLG